MTFENKWVVFLLRAGVYFPRGNTGSPFFLHEFPDFFMDTFSQKWYNNYESIDLRRQNRIRGNFILLFAEKEQEHNQNDLSNEVCFWLFFVVKNALRGGRRRLQGHNFLFSKYLQRRTYLCQKKTQPLTNHGLTK